LDRDLGRAVRRFCRLSWPRSRWRRPRRLERAPPPRSRQRGRPAQGSRAVGARLGRGRVRAARLAQLRASSTRRP